MEAATYLSSLISEQARKYGNKTVFTYQPFGCDKWENISWNELSLTVNKISIALLNAGISKGNAVGVFSPNCIEFHYIDFGAYGVNAISVPIHATCSEQQVCYIVNDAKIRILFVGEQEHYDKASRISAQCPSLERIIIFDRHVQRNSTDNTSLYLDEFINNTEKQASFTDLERLRRSINGNDLCNIIYTSGTTGEPKGVMLTYKQQRAAFSAWMKCVPVSEQDKVISFLPLTHIFERAWSYLCLTVGAQIVINTYTNRIQQSMCETNPTCMCTVPRFWEKIYIGVKEKMDKLPPLQRKLFKHALYIGKHHNVDFLANGKKPNALLKAEYKVMDWLVLRKIRLQFGLKNPNIFPTGGGIVLPELESFVRSIGLYIIIGYGLTESMATVTCDHKNKKCSIGSVGRPIEGIDIKIGNNGEVLLKGATVTQGYYNRPDLNATAFDQEGYFHTGDAGFLKDGELFLTDRIKDIFKTSNGKYIAPQAIETLLITDKYIQQAVVIADGRPFASALITPDYNLIRQYAKEKDIEYKDVKQLCSTPEIISMVMERINILQQLLSNHEKIKRIILLENPLSIEQGELTSTQKFRRKIIENNYKEQINAIYQS